MTLFLQLALTSIRDWYLKLSIRTRPFSIKSCINLYKGLILLFNTNFFHNNFACINLYKGLILLSSSCISEVTRWRSYACINLYKGLIPLWGWIKPRRPFSCINLYKGLIPAYCCCGDGNQQLALTSIRDWCLLFCSLCPSGKSCINLYKGLILRSSL